MIDHSQILKTLFASHEPKILAAGLGISRQAVHQWRKVPAERARDIERITGVSRETLRPDIYGAAG